MTRDFHLNSRSNSIGSFIYFASTIVRNVLSAKTVGLIHDGLDLKSWLIKNGLRTTFEFSNNQLRNSEITFNQSQKADCIVAFNPFDDFTQEEFERSIELFTKFDCAMILAVQSVEHNLTMPASLRTTLEWHEILEKYGRVIEVYRHSCYNLFLVMK